MDYERETKVPSALHQKRVKNLKEKLEDHWNILHSKNKHKENTDKRK